LTRLELFYLDIQAHKLYEFGHSKTPGQTALARLNDMHEKESSGMKRFAQSTVQYLGQARIGLAA
jgi:hypothetical protein